MTHSEPCIFCAIVARRAPSARIHEDELTLALLDIFPVARGHTLVITKDHYDNLFEAPLVALTAVMCTARRVALALRQEIAPAGLGVFQLNGAAAGQTVFHYHMHLIPRADGEPFLLHGRVRADDTELQQQAQRLTQIVAAIP